jgi:hypothetical protein
MNTRGNHYVTGMFKKLYSYNISSFVNEIGMNPLLSKKKNYYRVYIRPGWMGSRCLKKG